MSDATTPTPSTDESDIAYLKRLAVAGRGEPAPFLLLMAVFGGGYGFAILAVMIAFLIEGLPQPGGDVGPISEFLGRWAFVAAPIAFVLALGWTVWRTFGPNRIRLSRAAVATWSAAFIGLVTIVASMRLFTQGDTHLDHAYAANFLWPVLLTLWGCAWWVTGVTSERKWLLVVAIGSYAAAIGMAITANTPSMMPLICACLLLLAFVPAVILMRQRAR
ncbi:hypothetical protein KOAAANKH_01653 [Brevundimonas sp. NIBR10]|uniref:hypothetical protein n=1 Tax=Brevundimonas sp. NIBR10 TaxID=3015997 RepID=UPI0022F182AD|nr:hypothetical protein [Brevundimonas sp. NIBR10]WGM46780.1 hypothetical protein KOAAANKH_01653 [Brevundimonas sp. NIBR10]